MSIFAYINPQLFADEGAAAAPAGGGAEAGTAAESGTAEQTVNVGDTLSDGSQVQDPQVAAAMNKRLKQHPELRDAFFGQKAEQQIQGQQQMPAEEPTPEQWAEAKKKFAKFYGDDVKSAVKDRFKNQEDANAKLENVQPMLDALMKKLDVDNVDDLRDMILNDDSLYEEDAEKAGMSVEGYKRFKQLQDEHDQAIANQQKAEQQQQFQNHIIGLKQQADELRKIFPSFDFDSEIQNNEEFFRLTSPDYGLTVEQAYYALHGKEMIPQLLAYGMQRAQSQMGNTIQAQRARPAEGAMNGKNPAAAEPRIDPRKLSRPEQKKYKELIRMNKFTSFDR